MRKSLGPILGMTILLAACGALAESPTVEEMQATIENLKTRLAALESQVAKQASVSQEETRRIMKEVQADAASRSAAPGWLENLKFLGDLRLRYQGDSYNWGLTDEARKKARNRARFRLRFGFEKTWLDDQLEVGFRLASGSNNDPTSTNQTLGESASGEPPFAKRPVWIDLAYAKYSPRSLKGLTIIGGKMKNPWMTNEIFMDTDVNPEGFWAGYNVAGLGPVEPFTGVGYFVLTESAAGHDTILYGPQTGLNWQINKDLKYTFATYWQKYDHYDTAAASARGNDSPLARVPGFGVIGLTNNVGFKILRLPVSVFADWAHNCHAEDRQDDYGNANNAYATGVKVGQNKNKGDWSAQYCFAYVEANSLPGQFVDADFGFSNRKGHVVRATYNLLDNVTAGVAVLLTEPIFSPTTTSGSSAFEDRTVTVQTDLIWKF